MFPFSSYEESYFLLRKIPHRPSHEDFRHKWFMGGKCAVQHLEGVPSVKLLRSVALNREGASSQLTETVHRLVAKQEEQVVGIMYSSRDKN